MLRLRIKGKRCRPKWLLTSWSTGAETAAETHRAELAAELHKAELRTETRRTDREKNRKCGRREIGSYMLMQNQFVFFDFEEPLIFFFMDYMAVMVLFAFLGHYFAELMRCRSRKRKA